MCNHYLASYGISSAKMKAKNERTASGVSDGSHARVTTHTSYPGHDGVFASAKVFALRDDRCSHRTGVPSSPGIGSGSGGTDNTASESSPGEVGDRSGFSPTDVIYCNIYQLRLNLWDVVRSKRASCDVKRDVINVFGPVYLRTCSQATTVTDLTSAFNTHPGRLEHRLQTCISDRVPVFYSPRLRGPA